MDMLLQKMRALNKVTKTMPVHLELYDDGSNALFLNDRLSFVQEFKSIPDLIDFLDRSIEECRATGTFGT